LFKDVGQDGFEHYEAQHSNLTTLVVGPVMLLELLSALLLLWYPPAGIKTWQLYFGLGLVGIIWLSTAVLQVPQHGILAQGFNQQAYESLVTTNWLRTLAWTLRSLLVCYWLGLRLS
jgi:hypothetical protein